MNRVTYAHENFGNTTRLYEYDSLGNIVWERFDNGTPDYYDYRYNNLNQMLEKIIGGKDKYTYEYDARGNQTKESYVKNNGKITVVGEYTYDETNKMERGVNDIGETSSYMYNGLGALVENTWVVKKNAYGYHDVQPNQVTEGEIVIDAATGKKNAKEKMTAEELEASATLNKTSTIIKSFVIDYTSELKNVLYEEEAAGLSYRYGYGTDRISVHITPVPIGGGDLSENDAIKLYYHKDYLGTTDFMSSDKTGKIASWTMYNEWGEITHNAILKCGQRELDLVKNYTGYEYDSVIGQYFAKNRMYDPAIHRFTQIDPIKDGFNWYAYVENNPVNAVDPLGLLTVDLGKGWVARIDPAKLGINKRHIHLINGSDEYAQNDDGSPHDGSKGSPPKSVLKQIKKHSKLNWDWEKKESKFFKETQKFVSELGYAIKYADGKIVYIQYDTYDTYDPLAFLRIDIKQLYFDQFAGCVASKNVTFVPLVEIAPIQALQPSIRFLRPIMIGI